MSLTPEQIAFFAENGYLLVGRVLDDEALERLRERSEWIASGAAPHIPSGFLQVEPRVERGELAADDPILALRKLSHLAWYDAVMLEHARRAAIVDRIAALLG